MNRVLFGIDFDTVVGVVLYNSGVAWYDCKRTTFRRHPNEVCSFERDIVSAHQVHTMRVDEAAISAVLLRVKK